MKLKEFFVIKYLWTIVLLCRQYAT